MKIADNSVVTFHYELKDDQGNDMYVMYCGANAPKGITNNFGVVWVGEDGPTHHGVFDLTYLRMIPGMVVMAPADEDELAGSITHGDENQAGKEDVGQQTRS